MRQPRLARPTAASDGVERGTHSFQIVVQMSPSVTPRSFLMIVHHGLFSVMRISSPTRGSVAGSSFCVNCRSSSRAPGLKPPVWPAYSNSIQKKFGGDGAGSMRTGLQVEDEVEAGVGHGHDGVQLQLRLQEIEIGLREHRSI